MSEIRLGYDAQYGGTLAFEVKGLTALSAQLTALAEQMVPEAVGNALRAEAEIEMTEAKRRTPVDTGALKASGHVVGPEQDGDEMAVTLGFGGPAGIGNQGESNDRDVGYAVYVHENMEASHAHKAKGGGEVEVGQAKFLESVVLESSQYLAARVAARIAKTLGSA